VTNAVSILLVDDHVAIRKGLHVLLSAKPGWKIVGEACNGREAVESARAHQPDLIIADISMPQLNGLDAIPRLLRAAPNARIVILSMHDEEGLIQRALQAGASAFVLKSDAEPSLLTALDRVLKGKNFVSPSVTRIVLNGLPGKKNNHRSAGNCGLLTEREQEVVQLLAEGYSNKQIANQLMISVRTAENHRARLSKKLGVGSLSGLIRYAIRNHIISP
jgi:two-component system, NarL family, response regulator NreC